MDNPKSPREILDSLKEYFVEELKEILIAYEKSDAQEVDRLVSEIDRYCYAALILNKPSDEEQVPLFESDVMWEHYKKRFLGEGYEGISVDLLTAIFYWNLDKELRKTIYKEGKEVKSSEKEPKEKAFLNKIGAKIKTIGMFTGSIFYILFQIFNIILGIVPVIWLLIEGGWLIVIIGIAFGFISTFLILVINLPSFLLSAPFFLLCEKFAEKGKFSFSAFFYFLSTLYPSIAISVWSIFIMGTALNFSDDFSLLPLLLWSYIVALAPWMRGIEYDTSASGMSISVFACTSYLISIGILLLGFPHYFVSWTFILIMILGQAVISIVMYRHMKKNLYLK
jgi:hypothetical protein